MNSGDYKRLITFQNIQTNDEDQGSYSTEWRAFATVYAAIEPISGKEFNDLGGMQSTYTHRVRVRAIKGIKPEMRIQYVDGFEGKVRYFNIIHVKDAGTEHREIQLMCEERSYEQYD